MRAVPLVGGTSVVSMRMSVDLPGAVGPEQAEDLAVLDAEAEAVDGAEVAEALGQMVDFDVEHGDLGRRSRGGGRAPVIGRRAAG